MHKNKVKSTPEKKITILNYLHKSPFACNYYFYESNYYQLNNKSNLYLTFINVSNYPRDGVRKVI